MDRVTDLARLAEVMGLRRAHAQSVLAKTLASETELRRQLAQLRTDPAAEADRPGSDADRVRRAAAEMRWQRWADARRQTINSELARTLARKADARRALARAAGKDAALEALIHAARTKKGRRSD